jgi:hypothetical protein
MARGCGVERPAAFLALLPSGKHLGKALGNTPPPNGGYAPIGLADRFPFARVRRKSRPFNRMCGSVPAGTPWCACQRRARVPQLPRSLSRGAWVGRTSMQMDLGTRFGRTNFGRSPSRGARNRR